MMFYSTSGSDANEVAFKLIRQYHQQNGEGNRYKIIARYRGYHGSSLGALAATGQALRKFKYEPLTPGFLHVAPPDHYRRPKGQSIEAYSLALAREMEEKLFGSKRNHCGCHYGATHHGWWSAYSTSNLCQRSRAHL